MNKSKKIIHHIILFVFSILNLCKIGRGGARASSVMGNGKILYICLAERGDIIISSAAIKRIKLNFPESSIDYICNANYLSVAKLLPQVSVVRGISSSFSISNLFCLIRLMYEIRKNRYEFILDESGVHITFLLWFFSRARSVFVVNQLGFGRFSSESVNYDERDNILDRRKKLTDFICSDNFLFKPDIIYFPVEFSRCVSLPKRYVSFQPIAGWRGKNIDPELSSAIVSLVTSKFNMPIVVLGGGGDFEKTFDSCVNSELINLTGSLSVRESTAAVLYAEMHIGADSFLRHVATAVDTPSITIYGSTNHELSGYHDGDHISVFSDLDCRPVVMQYCSLSAGRACSHLSCMKNISIPGVLDIISSHMSRMQLI